MKIFYLILINLFSLNLLGQTVNFEWTTTTGTFCSPQVIKFKNTSSGNPTSLVWKFGNGKTGNRPIEEVLYNNSGTYNVQLIAIYGDLALNITKTITINPGPSLTLTSNKKEMCKTGEVKFTASGSSDIINYTWNFGDSNEEVNTTERSQIHNFNEFNNYTVKVTGKTQYGCLVSASTIVKINPLVATVSINKTSGCVPVATRLRVSANYITEDRMSEAIWNFGDGTTATSTSNNITHTYITTQDITSANVKVISNMGCEATASLERIAFGVPPTQLSIRTVEPVDSFCSSEKIKFVANATNANYYVWNWGVTNKDSINGNDATHRFRVLGDISNIVTPYMNGCAGSIDSIHIFIKGVVAGFGVRNTCTEKNSFTFPARTRGNVSHLQWTYGGDFATITDTSSRNGSFTYPHVGVGFIEQLVIDDLTACRDSFKTNIYTALPHLEVNTNSVCKDSLIVYSVRNDYPAEAKFKYIYNVNGVIEDNGNVSSLSYYPHEHGIFNDYLVIADNFAETCNDTLRLNEAIKVKGPVVNFDSPGLICYDTMVTLVNNSIPFFADEPIVENHWDFGNGTTSNAVTPDPFLFDRSGNYNISLTVTDGSRCSEKLIKPVLINPLPKVDILPGVDTLCSGGSRQLIAYSSDSIFWMNNAGINCIKCDTITVRPTTTTNYIVTAISAYGCKNEDNSLIKVYEPINLRISPLDTALCAGTKLQYNTNLSEGIILWEPATGLNDNKSFNPFVTATNDIEYKVTIKDSVGCFSDSAIVKLKVNQLPVVDAGADKILSFDDSFVITPVYSSGIISYNWDYSPNINCSNCPNPSGIMKNTETLIVSVEDINGCRASDKINLILDCSTSTLLLPNAFTPNGDGLNDYFYPLAKGYEEIKSFSVYDRSGFKVFERQNFAPNQQNLGWNGLTKGVEPNTQTYVWVAQVVCQGNVITKKGVVTLIR